jgi:hypothetical protein
MQVERGAYGRLRGGFGYDEGDKRPSLVGQVAFVASIRNEEEEEEAKVVSESGITTWWPVAFIDPIHKEEVGVVVDVGSVDVSNYEALHDAAMKIVTRMEMLGTPTRVSIFISDTRDPDNATIVGGPVSRGMARGHYNREESPGSMLRKLLGA